MRRIIKRVAAVAAAAVMTLSFVPVVANAATVTKGEYDFSNMTIRRVWFNTNDPVFLIDNYNRVWLDKNANVVASGNYKTITSDGDLMAPMKEMFAQIGAEYTEEGNDITIKMNGDTLRLTIGSNDVVYNGAVKMDALSAAQVPSKINAKEAFADANTYLTSDYYVTYLPVAYVLNTFQADIYVDGNVQSFYAAIPIFNNDNVSSYDTVAEGYGNRYDDLLEGTLSADVLIADNIVALQNSDGGFQKLPDNADMNQENLAVRLGTLRSTSTLENGATTAELKYLADFIRTAEPEDGKYQNAFNKGVEYLLNSQDACGAWKMAPTAAEGFNGNIVIGNQVTTAVLDLFNQVAVVDNEAYEPVRKAVGKETLKAMADAVGKGNKFLVTSQIANAGKKGGWASQYKTDGSVTMGRTYERESVSAFTTKEVVDYLMSVYNPSKEMQDAAHNAIKWLSEVKLADKEQSVVRDISMNNGFDVYLVDGSGTWASNYVYDSDTSSYRPLYSDVDPTRPDQKFVNTYQLDQADRNKLNVSSKDMILYATRTTLSYYDNELAVNLIDVKYDEWKNYLVNGFPFEAVDIDKVYPDITEDPTQGGTEDPTTAPGSDSSDDSLQTGDKTPIGMFICLAAVSSCIIVAGLYFYNKKKKISIK